MAGDSNEEKNKYRRENKELKEKNRKLEKELARKEKALAEASALLVLQKKVRQIFEDREDD